MEQFASTVRESTASLRDLLFTTALHGFMWVLSTTNASGFLQMSTLQTEEQALLCGLRRISKASGCAFRSS